MPTIHPDRGGRAGRWWGALAVALLVSLPTMTRPASAAPDGPDRLGQLLPALLEGYVPAGPDGRYGASTLFELIDGAAEVYRSLNVQQVLSRRYAKPGEAEVMVDLFEMGSSADAWGAYHHDVRDGPPAPGVGQESEHGGALLAFWRDRFFVSIVALAESEASHRVVLALGRAISRAIGRDGARPPLLALLPTDGLIVNQINLFHDWPYLSTRYFLAEENLLELGRQTDGLLARYRDDQRGTGATAAPEPYLLLLVSYPGEDAARQAHRRFLAGYLHDADGDGVVRTEQGRWAAAFQQGSLLLCVLEAPRREVVFARRRQVFPAAVPSRR